MKKQVFVFAVLLAMGQLLSAAPISGSFGNFGPAAIAFSLDGASFVDFCPKAALPVGSTNPGCAVDDTGQGQLYATGTASGDFEGTPIFTPVTILDISNMPGMGMFTYFPINTPVAIDNFITLATRPDLNFQANLLACEAPGCVPGGAVQLNEASLNQTIATVTFNGTVFDAEGVAGSFQAILTGQFNMGRDAVLAAAASQGGVLTQSYSMDVIVTPIPEPSVAVLVGSALLLVPVAFRARRRRS